MNLKQFAKAPKDVFLFSLFSDDSPLFFPFWHHPMEEETKKSNLYFDETTRTSVAYAIPSWKELR